MLGDEVMGHRQRAPPHFGCHVFEKDVQSEEEKTLDGIERDKEKGERKLAASFPRLLEDALLLNPP